MADPLRERTERLLADYLGCCAREPGTPEPRPSTPEAAVLRSAAARLRQLHRSFFSAYRGYPGNRVELVALMAEAVLSDSPGPTWGRVVSLVTFAGTLLEREPLVTAWWKKRGFQPRLKEQEGDVARDCQRLVALLSSRLAGQHRAWLQAQGGWDGFCHFFRSPFPLAFWRKLLIQAFLACLLATAFGYLWTRLL
ncbi:bcl-2-like protein 10 isoform X1 [Macaca nemestrina]|uniref:Bcl-2-like protein 10 n=2 Tax=Macaca TaxID=9539 RepID=F7H6U5_MACMU|nr:bcl-2-like protein 10 isoform X2 [Macaca mulatta]XP_005559635.1 bcl-2-like protein 10 isoform X1 [Macaca fascicularis]XP_011753925.1 bcl-2-like protein 10 [Macaca nemestrina]XP_050653907.1 bcl-2-like protein 10 [Macaca thibetana thibetana]